MSHLKQWVHRIGRKNLPINSYTRVCSSHFVQAAGRRLRPDEVPSLNLPVLTSVARSTPRRPKERAFQSMSPRVDSEAEDSCTSTRDAFTQVENISTNATEGELALRGESTELLKAKVIVLEKQVFRLSNIKDDDSKVQFYTDLCHMGHCRLCFYFGGLV